MRLEQYPEDQLKRALLEILGRHLDVSRYRVFETRGTRTKFVATAVPKGQVRWLTAGGSILRR